MENEQISVVESQVSLERTVDAGVPGEQRGPDGLQVCAAQPAGRSEIGNSGQRTSGGELFSQGRRPLDSSRQGGEGSVQGMCIRHGFYRVSGNVMASREWVTGGRQNLNGFEVSAKSKHGGLGRSSQGKVK